MGSAVTVIGAGVAGLSCAWQLARKGYNVKVIHADPIGTGASANAAGALKPFDALQTGRKQKLQIQSLWQYPQFLEELNADSGMNVQMNRCGRYAVYHKERGWQKTCEAAAVATADWPYPQETLAPDALNLPEETIGILHCHATAIFSPSEILQALHKACLNKGVKFDCMKLDELPTETPVVVAAGAWSAEFGSQPVRPIKRQAILLEWPEDKPLEYILENGQVYLVPWNNGEAVYVGSTFEPEAKFDAAPTREAEQHLRTQAARLVPGLAAAPLLDRFSGLQSRGQDAETNSTLLLGEDPKHSGVFMATGHGGVGFCMAPITAQVICDEIDAFFARQ